jgi:NADH-quinone oxidoreductase subunit F
MDDTCIVKNTWNYSRFYHHESCVPVPAARAPAGSLRKYCTGLEHGRLHVHDIDLIVSVLLN